MQWFTAKATKIVKQSGYAKVGSGLLACGWKSYLFSSTNKCFEVNPRTGLNRFEGSLWYLMQWLAWPYQAVEHLKGSGIHFNIEVIDCIVGGGVKAADSKCDKAILVGNKVGIFRTRLAVLRRLSQLQYLRGTGEEAVSSSIKLDEYTCFNAGVLEKRKVVNNVLRPANGFCSIAKSYAVKKVRLDCSKPWIVSLLNGMITRLLTIHGVRRSEVKNLWTEGSL